MLSIIISDDAAQLLATIDPAFGCRREIDVKNIVTDVFASVWPSCVVIVDPDRIDMVKMIHTEAEEVVQAFALKCSDE